MATIGEQIVVSVEIDVGEAAAKLAEVNKEIEATKMQQRELKKAIAEGNDEFGENTRLLVENENKIKDLNSTAAALKGQITQNTTANKEYGTSIKEQSRLLAALKEQYRGLTKEQRESAKGTELRDQIKALDEEIKNADYSLGDHQRNVGNYASALEGLVGGLGGSTKGFQTFQGGIKGAAQGLKALGTIPIIAIIGAIVVIFQKLSQAIKGNEEQTMKMQEVFASLRPLMDAVKNGITQLANGLIWLVNGAIKVATAALEGLAKAADWVGRLFGADWGLAEKTQQLKANAAAQRELVAAENEYALNKRNFTVEEAKNERDIAELRAKVAEKDKYTAKERKQFLNEAIELEERNAQRKKELAEENLRLLRLEADRTANDAETNDKLAAAEVEVIKADTELAQSKRRLNAESAALSKTIREEEAEAYKESIERLKEYRKEIGKLVEALPSLKEAQDKSVSEAAERAKNAYEQQSAAINELQSAYDEFSINLEKYNEEVEVTSTLSDKMASVFEKLQHAFSKYGEVIGETAAQIGNSFGSIGDIYQQIADDETKSEEERAKAARKSKAFAVVQLASNSAVALSKSIAAAADLPFPANLASIAASVATVLSFIAQARSLFKDAEGFETGGIIGGVHGATMGNDNTVIKAREGEMVLNATQQRRLLSVAEGFSTQGGLSAEMARAFASIPAPIVDYREFTEFQSRVATMTEVSTIR